MNWPLQQLRRMARIRNGSDHSAVVEPDGAFPVYGSGGEFARACRPLHEGPAVLLGRKGTIDKPLLVDGKFWTVDTMFCAKPLPNTEPRFLYYACTTIPFGMFSTSTALPSMTQGDLNAVRLPCPPFEDQEAVADFLDRETAKIDALISKQEQLIAVLREDRTATITHAVTKGLDHHAQFKAIGVDLPEVPNHWQIQPIKYLGRLITGRTPATNEEAYYCDNDDGFPWFRPEDLDTTGVPSRSSRWISDAGWATVPHLVAPSVHVVSIGATLGKIGYVEVLSSSNQQITAIVEASVPRFLFFALTASYGQIWAASMGNTLPIISAGRLGAIKIPVPPQEEQKAIVVHLDERCSAIDALIEKAEGSVTLLREYRSALITDAVTGKINVRTAAA